MLRKGVNMLKGLFNRKDSANRSLLIVDDDPAVRQMLVQILKGEGYAVQTASNGREALKVLEQGSLPNAMILDLMMPDMKGDEFLEKARIRFGRSKLPPVLFLTGSKQGEARANSLEAEDYLPKPFDSDSLLQHVRRLVEAKA
jgi:CheY-like chemotaxis protein